jgi:hypothetical protein
LSLPSNGEPDARCTVVFLLLFAAPCGGKQRKQEKSKKVMGRDQDPPILHFEDGRNALGIWEIDLIFIRL